MIANPEYDLAKPLASALKAKAPYVGIPIPGHAPLIFNRLLLVRALNGVRPVHIEVIVHPDVADRWLVVDGVANESPSGNIRVRHHMKVRAIPRRELCGYSPIAREWDRWLDSERKPKVQAPLGKHAKAIAKLERQLEKLGPRPRIENPAVVTLRYRIDDGWRAQWLTWRAQRKLRGKIGAIAKAGKPSRELYAALRALGLAKVRTFSDLNTREKLSIAPRPDQEDSRHGWRREGTYLDYAHPKRLWRFQPGLAGADRGKPRLLEAYYLDPEHWGAKRYKYALEWSRERQELLSQIAGIRVMMEPETEDGDAHL